MKNLFLNFVYKFQKSLPRPKKKQKQIECSYLYYTGRGNNELTFPQPFVCLYSPPTINTFSETPAIHSKYYYFWAKLHTNTSGSIFQ